MFSFVDWINKTKAGVLEVLESDKGRIPAIKA
jgi:hypothetical protein